MDSSAQRPRPPGVADRRGIPRASLRAAPGATSSGLASSISERLRALSRNLWWTWHPEIIALLREIDPALWRQTNHNPVTFLAAIAPDDLERRASELNLEAGVALAFHRLEEYLEGRDAPLQGKLGPLQVRPVAYFSAEFGLHESLPLYSGGLGVLAGDHLKSASDLGLPIVGVGLMYAQGYFRQRLDRDGNQIEEYPHTDLSLLPLERPRDEQDRELRVRIETGTSVVHAAVWTAEVGRSRLLLLDSDVPENDAADRELTSRLYGGDARTRIRQELVLGVGGVRALAALGVEPSVLHLNEGHTAFAALEWARRIAAYDDVDLARAREEVAARTVFTTHTAVEAAHDRFAPDLVREQLGPLLGGSARVEELLALGRLGSSPAEPFCMTAFAIRSSDRVNAVSARHARVTRRMWRDLWPGRRAGEVPIGHVTNGVHALSWLSPQMYALIAEHLGSDWPRRMCCEEAWDGIDRVGDLELWETRNAQRRHLIDFVRRRLVACASGSGDGDPTRRAASLRNEALTIGFARRFAGYKRPTLLTRDPDRLAQLLGDAGREVQVVFAGKSHPRDEEGKRGVREIAALQADPRFEGRLVFLEDYDYSVARHLVQGVDLWLNVPSPPQEACGTSGQKVVLNGALHLSTLDGWWAEAYDGSNGFAIGHGRSHASAEVQDAYDARSLLDALEEVVVPMFHERDARGVPVAWVARMKRAIRTLAWRFNSDRMVRDYVRESYLPASGAMSCDVAGPRSRASTRVDRNGDGTREPRAQ